MNTLKGLVLGVRFFLNFTNLNSLDAQVNLDFKSENKKLITYYSLLITHSLGFLVNFLHFTIT